MEYKRRIRSALLTCAACITAGCSSELNDEHMRYDGETVEVHISYMTGSLATKAINPDEERITDVSLIIFDENGDAEESLWMGNGAGGCKVNLVKGRRYTFCACANFGYRVNVSHISELSEIRYHLAYPDEYREGIPMYAQEKDIFIESGMTLSLQLIRLMSKINIRMDRSRLSENVKMDVRSVKVGNCPKSVRVFGKSKVMDRDDCFAAGFSRNDMETQELNTNGPGGIGISKEVSLYMLENMQGDFPEEITDSKDKVFSEDDHMRDICSYIEMEFDYMSEEYKTDGKRLIYRFYLGDGTSNLDVERNCLYTITVCPEDDGLHDGGWRVDKSGLSPAIPPSFRAYPSSYIRGDIGDRIHIWCEFTPAYGPFNAGTEYMEDDKAKGIYSYTLDEDGHGATLELTGPGRGLIYMEAGPPVNESALFIIEVNLPPADDS